MSDYFGFVFQIIMVFSALWYFGVNFFKHSHEIAGWIERRKLQKLADENQDKILDMAEVYKKEFGFLEEPEYIKARLSEIKESLSDKEKESIEINALEFIFLVDELETQILKTDKGIYIASKKNIKELVMEGERDTLFYAKKMREYALRFLPKEGEPIVLNADEVLYWIRNGMLRRPTVEGDNKMFQIKSTMEEVCFNMQEDFVEPHYSLSLVSHSDFLKIKGRREALSKQRSQKKSFVVQPENRLQEGMMVLFDDNTLRMKVGSEVFITDASGRTHKEDLKGNVIEEESSTNYSKQNHTPVNKDAFIIKDANKLQESLITESEEEAVIPNSIKLHASKVKVDDGKAKAGIGIFSSEKELNKFLLKKEEVRKALIQKLYQNHFPSIFYEKERGCLYIEEDVLIHEYASFLNEISSNIFIEKMKKEDIAQRRQHLLKFYLLLEKGKITSFLSRAKGAIPCTFQKDDKRFEKRVIPIVYEKEYLQEKFTYISSILEAYVETNTLKKKNESTEQTLKHKKVKRVALNPKEKDTREVEKKEIKLKLKKKEVSPKAQEHKIKEKKKQTKMSKKVFLQKILTESYLFGEECFLEEEDFCKRRYLSFQLGEEQSVKLFFQTEYFKKILFRFLEDENMEWSPSTRFLNLFLRDDNKGDISTRYFWTSPDNTSYSFSTISLSVPRKYIEGLKMDLGLRGGYRLAEFKRVMEEALSIGDNAFAEEIQILSNHIKQERYFRCEGRE